MTVAEAPSALFEKHKAQLDDAVSAIRARTYWSAYPEVPSGKIYGETAKADGEAAFKGYLDKPFTLDEPSDGGTAGDERSPYGFALGVRYPKIDVEQTLAAAKKAGQSWAAASPAVRTGVALEILARLNARSFEMAYAVMHTSGQGFVMAFQAGGPHAQDRALEAVAYAYSEMASVPQHVVWEKPQGKNPPLRFDKQYRILPRGIALAIGCSTFPTWNSYPGIFASFVTGNPVIVKPHPNAILPLAITVAVARDVLREAGFDPNVMQLAADDTTRPLAKELALRPEIAIIDYTGGSAFGNWLEQNATQAVVYTEKAGVNSVIVDSTSDLDGLVRNLAFSLSLYSGQMCTTPQNIFVPRDGFAAGDKHVSFDEFTAALGAAITGLTSDDEKAVEFLGAIATDATLERLEKASDMGHVLLASRTVNDARFPGARIRTTALLRAEPAADAAFMHEQFGPIAFVIPTNGTSDSLNRAMELAHQRGAITGLLYSTDEALIAQASDLAAQTGVLFSVNLYGAAYVNQNAAFSDYHVTGANPAGNASLTDTQFVAGRFRIVQTRVPAAG